jgi:hypothetical protein
VADATRTREERGTMGLEVGVILSRVYNRLISKNYMGENAKCEYKSWRYCKLLDISGTIKLHGKKSLLIHPLLQVRSKIR